MARTAARSTNLHLVEATAPQGRVQEDTLGTDLFRTLLYRRYRGGDVWHYHPACADWPADDGRDFTEQRETPYGYPFCRACDEHIALDYVLKRRQPRTHPDPTTQRA